MVFFEYEAAFELIYYVRKCWVHQPDRAIVEKIAVWEYFYAFTRVCEQTEETSSIISPFCKTEAMNSLLSGTSISFPKYKLIMIIDSAGLLTTNRLVLPKNIILFTPIRQN